MMHIHSELGLIETIQKKALERASLFEKEVFEKQPFSPQAGREIVEGFLWKEDDLPGSGNERPARENTIYSLLSEGIKTAVIDWKKDRHQSLPTIISISISYNSRLYDLEWMQAKRVLARNGRGYYQNYHWHSSRGTNTMPATGRMELWFSILLIKMLSSSKSEDFPTIHNYLSEFKPTYIDNDYETTPISAVTFYTNEDRDNGYSQVLNEEANIITRKDTEEHQYIELEGQDINSLTESLKELVDETKIRLEGDPFKQEDDPSKRRSSVLTHWLYRYAFFLRNTVMRTRDDLAADSPPLLDEFHLGEEVVKESKLIFDYEKQLQHNSGPIDWGGVSYRSMTNIRVSVPESNNDLGSIVLFSDRIIGPRLSKVIASAIWPIFSHLRQVEESVISKENMRKHALRSAVAAIMGRNMSHNIGSHVLAYLSSEDMEANLWVVS